MADLRDELAQGTTEGQAPVELDGQQVLPNGQPEAIAEGEELALDGHVPTIPGGPSDPWIGDEDKYGPEPSPATAGAMASVNLLRPAAVVLALAGILVVGAFFRFTGVNWDSYTHLHPDERFITMVENSIGWPKSFDEYLDTAKSPLNPYNKGYDSFVYGTFPLFLVKWIGLQLNMNGYDEIHLVGRVTSAFFDLLSVLLIFFIGRRLFGTRAGLLASLFTAGAVIQIQQSHFFTFDTFVGFFLLASFYFAVRLWQNPRPIDYPLLGVSMGLAMASKINSALFAVIVAIVALKQLREVTASMPNNRMGEWMAVVGRFSVAALAGLVVFRLAEPYAFSGPGLFNVGLSTKFLNDMGFVSKLVSGEIDQPPSVQWAGTPSYLFPFRNLVMWGMGLPLGVAGWAGLLFGAYRLVKWRDPRYVLVVAWVGFFFLYQGGQFAKTMRYFLPLVPLLALLGGHMLLEAYEWGRERLAASRGSAMLARYAKVGALSAMVVVGLGTLIYAFAFTSIYTRPVTRIAATEWIFQNIPQGTPIANEHWDDPLPLRWKGRDAGFYQGDMLELYHDDNPEKYRKLLEQLDRTQYIFLSSNRLYGSIPRMPAKYPLTTEYYRLLFSGELGFQMEKTFTSHPQVLGIEFNDDSAEEIFSVYDHPKVLIFRKTADYSPAKTRQLLGAVPLDRVLNVKSVEMQYNGLLLKDAEREAQQSGGTWSELYQVGSLSNQFPTVTWWLALEVLGLLALPVTWALFRRFPDRGYGLTKVVGLVVVVYVAWLLASVRAVPFGPGAIIAGMVVLFVASALVLLRHRSALREYLLANRMVLLAHELVFLAAFGLFWLVRANNPDLWHLNFGGEKPMEFAYLNAVAKSTYFPPYDPWLAGGYINYYYFGFVIVASLIRLTGIVPTVAFNLAIPTMFALTAVALFSLGLNISAARGLASRVLTRGTLVAGLATAVFVLIAGNLDGAIQRLESLWSIGGSQFKSTIPFLEGMVRAWPGLIGVLFGGKSLPPLDFWRSTRLVPGENPTPIMEFPFFTFLYSDLHPHMISMPVAVLAISLALAIVWQGRERPWTVRERTVTILFAGLVVGMLQATNSWDFPTYLMLISAAFLVSSFVRERELNLNGVLVAGASAALTYVVAYVLFLPYTRNYQLFYNGIDPSPAKTDIRYYLVMFGFFLFCIGSALIYGVATDRWHQFQLRSLMERFSDPGRWERRRQLSSFMVKPSPWMELLPWAVAFLVALVLGAIIARQFLVALLVTVCLLALLALFQRNSSPERKLLVLFVGLGAVLTLGVEFVTIKGDIGRMNTVFKFYLQAWFLFGIASALLGAEMLRRWRLDGAGPSSGWHRWWSAAALLLLIAVLVYPLGATPTKVGARFTSTPPTLDGMAYMKVAPPFKEQNNTDIVLAKDYEAIRWIQDRVTGSPVVLEAQVPEYRWGSRVSIYTGLPTVLGWGWHQRQQRSGYGWMIDQRLRDVKTLYETADIAVATTLLKKYGVGLVYVGDLERAYYPRTGLAKFERMATTGALTPVYEANGVTIFEVKRDGQPSLVRNRPPQAGEG